jgi:hypothetical protein
MSLINDALKKAQRQRTQTPYDVQPPVPGGGPVPKRGSPMAAQTIVLIAGGCALLVVVSIGITIFLVRGKTPAPAPTPAPVVAKIEPPSPQPQPVAPKITAPLLPPLLPPIAPASVSEKSPATSEATSPKSPVVETKPEPKSPPPPVKTPVAVVEEAPKKAPPPVTAPSEERVQAFLDAMRVAGVRASGADSRALLNDRVYRVNDLVDRTLNLRLTKVAADSLTFTDPHGVVYVKQF